LKDTKKKKEKNSEKNKEKKRYKPEKKKKATWIFIFSLPSFNFSTHSLNNHEQREILWPLDQTGAANAHWQS